MKYIKVLGIDLAKNVFQLHGTDGKGNCVLRKRLSRAKLAEFIVKLTPCLIGLEACMSAHYWARLFEQMGHTVKMMSPQFVKPYVISNKNDRNDARGIAEAVTRPNMKFVPIKKVEQQDMLLLHRARELIVKQKTAQSNQIRGLLAEYGIIIPKGFSHLKRLLEILEENNHKLTLQSKEIFKRLYGQYKALETQLTIYNKEIEKIVSQATQCQKILEIEGVGPLTASAVVATLGNAKTFKNGREVSAWLGLTPKQCSSGDKLRLTRISKRGDRYVRTLLVHGARSAVKTCGTKVDKRSQWVNDKKYRCGYNKAAVALANKNARIIWALLTTGDDYRRPAVVI